MSMFGSTGCPFRRELFAAEQRQCDGQEISTVDVLAPLQRPLRIVQSYNRDDVL